ncbi:hypothetical protein [Prosthecobacter sp.]|uniref:hypothetical protein n=1 Tax=Prosthecobacter sp. TaxID=1965333 RepID=UPI003784F66E
MKTSSPFIRFAVLMSSLTLLIVYVLNSQSRHRTVVDSHSKYQAVTHSQYKYSIVPFERVMFSGSKAPPNLFSTHEVQNAINDAKRNPATIEVLSALGIPGIPTLTLSPSNPSDAATNVISDENATPPPKP